MAPPPSIEHAAGGLATLGPEMVALRAALEDRFLSWAAQSGAGQAIYPALMKVDDLASVDYFRNFPHLAVMATGIAPQALAERAACCDELQAVPADELNEARYALPSAACFNVYLHLREQTLQHPFMVTTGANCFRREDHYDGLRRLLGFYMREIVCVGNRDAVLDHLSVSKARLLAFTQALGLPVQIVPSSDPFFDPAGARGVMAQLFPVKEEVVFGDDLAIASLNHHRNFFGERCDIRVADGSHAHSGCVAFGLERWISALTTHFNEPPGQLATRVAAATN
jgi:hypothetical protein